MCPSPAFPRVFSVSLALLVSPAVVLGQEPEADTLPSAIDTLGAARDTLAAPRGDPRLTWLGDTLSPADTTMPKFSALPEVWADSLVDPYTLHRPGAWPEWELIGDELLGRGAFSLLDVLESEALVVGDDLGGVGMPMFLGSAHGTGTNAQVVIDGVPVGHGLAANWDLRQIPVEAIARVAWYPGPQAAAWGGDGTGGVLEITTRQHLAPSARSTLGFLAGSNDAQAFSGNFGRSVTSRGDLFLAANFDDSEGALGGTREDFTRNQLVAKLGWRIGNRHRIEVSRLSDGLTGEADRDNVVGEEDQDASLIHLFYHGRIGPIEARARYWREERDIDRNYDFRQVPGLFGASDRSGTRLDLAFRRAGWLAWVSAGRDETELESGHGAFLRGDGTSLLEPPPEDDPDAPRLANPRERVEWGGGLGWQGLEGDLAVNLAVRRASWDEAAEDGTSWQLEAVGRPVEGLSLRAAGGVARRPPDFVGQGLLEQFGGTLEIHPDRRAEPEDLERWSGWRVEAAWRRPGWRIAGRAFGATGESAFLWAPPSAWIYFDRTNVELVRLQGIPFNTFDVVDLSISGFEGELVLPLPWYDLQGRLQYRHHSTVEDELTDDQVVNVPENQALGQLRYASRFFPSRDLLIEARLTGRYVGERPVIDPDEAPLPDYLATDLLVQGTVINFTVFLSFKNIAGIAYRSEEDFFLPGREGYFGVVWRFRN